MNYNLLEEKWIPVLFANGKVERVGIKDALTLAHHIRQIAASNPMDRVAITRFLLALLYWCKGNPPTGELPNSNGSFPSEWFSKLDENRDCFNLLGEGKRFLQNRVGSDIERTVNYLIHEIPTGTNKWHFRHTTDDVDGLCPACCATGILRLPMFTTSGGKGYPPGINSKPPIYIMPVGDSLGESLLLSWKHVLNVGIPTWEKPEMELPKDGEIPFLTGLTWLQRRVWLGNPDQSKAICALCGGMEYLIRKSVVAGKKSMKQDESGPKRIWRDPHVIYEKDETQSLHASDALAASDASAGQWTRILAGTLRGNDKGPIWGVGFASVKNDKYLEALEIRIPFPSTQQGIQESLEKIEKWGREGGKLATKLRPTAETKSAREREDSKLTSILSSIRPHVEARVSAKAGELLAGGDTAWEKAAEEYRPMMEVIAESLSPGFTTAALQRRNRIANTLPDMHPKSEPPKKPAKKKGKSK